MLKEVPLMGRRLMIALAVSALSAVAAAPAIAKSHKTAKVLVVSTKISHTHKLARAVPRISGFTPSSIPTLQDSVLYNGFSSECTAPGNASQTQPDQANGQNLFTSDTYEVENGNKLSLTLNCAANLSTAKGVDGKAIAYNHSSIVVAQVTSCRLYSSKSDSKTVSGTGVSVTFPDGLWIETCTSNFPPL
jgi:hypothetical protein